MSVRAGKAAKGAPAHQNTFAFRLNPRSRKTKAILAMPGTTDNLCPRCAAIIEWRKKYRKYKVPKSRKHCNGCSEKAVALAYHHLCQPCAQDKQQCAKCMTPRDAWRAVEPGDVGGGEDDDEGDSEDEAAPPPKPARARASEPPAVTVSPAPVVPTEAAPPGDGK